MDEQKTSVINKIWNELKIIQGYSKPPNYTFYDSVSQHRLVNVIYSYMYFSQCITFNNFLVQWIKCRTEISGSNSAKTFVYVNAIHFENNKFPKIVTFSVFFNLFSCKNIISLKNTPYYADLRKFSQRCGGLKNEDWIWILFAK